MYEYRYINIFIRWAGESVDYPWWRKDWRREVSLFKCKQNFIICLFNNSNKDSRNFSALTCAYFGFVLVFFLFSLFLSCFDCLSMSVFTRGRYKDWHIAIIIFHFYATLLFVVSDDKLYAYARSFHHSFLAAQATLQKLSYSIFWVVSLHVCCLYVRKLSIWTQSHVYLLFYMSGSDLRLVNFDNFDGIRNMQWRKKNSYDLVQFKTFITKK